MCHLRLCLFASQTSAPFSPPSPAAHPASPSGSTGLFTASAGRLLIFHFYRLLDHSLPLVRNSAAVEVNLFFWVIFLLHEESWQVLERITYFCEISDFAEHSCFHGHNFLFMHSVCSLCVVMMVVCLFRSGLHNLWHTKPMSWPLPGHHFGIWNCNHGIPLGQSVFLWKL